MIFRACPVTPSAGYANNARNVYTGGSLYDLGAYYGCFGVRPDLVENATE